MEKDKWQKMITPYEILKMCSKWIRGLNAQNFYCAYETLVNITVGGYEILLSQR